MGASGSGKSTLLGLLAGLDTPTSGTIVIDGVDITGLSEDKLALVRGRKIGFVFQSYQLIPTLTAEENVLLPHELAGGNGSAGVARARMPEGPARGSCLTMRTLRGTSGASPAFFRSFCPFCPWDLRQKCGMAITRRE